MAEPKVDVVLYSGDSAKREAVIEGVGVKPSKDSPRINWIQTATAPGAAEAVLEHNPPLVVLDAETPKVGGMAVAQEILNELDADPVIVLLTARPQDDWLATWSGATYTVQSPLDPLELQVVMEKALRDIA